jgi:hypothetical protein
MFPVTSKIRNDETLFGSPNTSWRNKEYGWLRKGVELGTGKTLEPSEFEFEDIFIGGLLNWRGCSGGRRGILDGTRPGRRPEIYTYRWPPFYFVSPSRATREKCQNY